MNLLLTYHFIFKSHSSQFSMSHKSPFFVSQNSGVCATQFCRVFMHVTILLIILKRNCSVTREKTFIPFCNELWPYWWIYCLFSPKNYLHDTRINFLCADEYMYPMRIFAGQSPWKSLKAFLKTLISISNSSFCLDCVFFYS